MNTTAVDVSTIPPLRHREAMQLAATEYDRFVAAADALSEEDWSRQTANELWDVKAMLGHVLATMKANASIREMIRQQRLSGAAAKASGAYPVDELTALQVREHAESTPAEVKVGLTSMAPKALKGRRRTPAPLRAVRIDPGPPFDGKWRIGYVIDVIYTRDTWMHRSDLALAVDREMVLTADHDGRIVADVVREWAATHDQAFSLVLSGPAGGTYTSGTGGEHIELDAVEFCRILSGRGTGDGLLKTGVPF